MLTPLGFYSPPPPFVAPGDAPSPSEVTGWSIRVTRGESGMKATLTEHYQRRLPDTLLGAEGTLRRLVTGKVERAEVDLGWLTMSPLPCGHNTCGLTWLLVEMLGSLAQGAQCGGVEMDLSDDAEICSPAGIEFEMNPLW